MHTIYYQYSYIWINNLKIQKGMVHMDGSFFRSPVRTNNNLDFVYLNVTHISSQRFQKIFVKHNKTLNLLHLLLLN